MLNIDNHPRVSPNLTMIVLDLSEQRFPEPSSARERPVDEYGWSFVSDEVSGGNYRLDSRDLDDRISSDTETDVTHGRNDAGNSSGGEDLSDGEDFSPRNSSDGRTQTDQLSNADSDAASDADAEFDPEDSQLADSMGHLSMVSCSIVSRFSCASLICYDQDDTGFKKFVRKMEMMNQVSLHLSRRSLLTHQSSRTNH